jgi:hypothetical protein
VRFGFKTSPQHTTWTAMLDVWRAADDIELYAMAVRRARRGQNPGVSDQGLCESRA